MAQAYCPTCKTYPDTLFTYPVVGIDHATGDLVKTEEGVFLNNAGKALNQWTDGAFGVPAAVKEMAEEDDEPYCAECYGFIDWQH